MRRLLIVFILVLFSVGSLFASFETAPYFNMAFSEGTAIPSKGSKNWFFSTNLKTDLGFIVRPSERQSFIGFYQLKYTGPGLHRQEGKEFTDRSVDHALFLQHSFEIFEGLLLKTKADVMQEFYRAGTDEAWGLGTYDFSRYGGEVKLEKKEFPFENFYSQVWVGYHFLNFPNYTDLLYEYQHPDEDIESAAGKQNQNSAVFGVSLGNKTGKIALRNDMNFYTKQKVIDADTKSYSSKRQLEIMPTLTGEAAFELGRFKISPNFSYKIKMSNQNYLHYKVVPATNPVTQIDCISDYYDYNQFSVSSMFSFRYTKTKSLFLSPYLELRLYTRRPPRNVTGDWLWGTKQHNFLSAISFGYLFHPNEVYRFSLYYTYQAQMSTMKYEKYYPYNYRGHYIGMKFTFTY